MKNMIKRFAGPVIISGVMIAALAGCGAKNVTTTEQSASVQTTEGVTSVITETVSAPANNETEAVNETAADAGSVENSAQQEQSTEANSSAAATEAVTVSANVTSDGAIDASDLFTDRDLRQTADLSEAVSYTVSDGEDIEITSEGVYVISGSASNATIIVDADSEDKVQIVLDGVSITNDDFPAIYVKSADKVFITTTDSDNTLAVTGTFTADGETNTDAVIFSRDDLVFNGLGTLTIDSTDNGIAGKDDIKITGGTLIITCESDAIEAHDSIAIADGNISIVTRNDGLKAKDSDDDSTGYIYICGGKIYIEAGDDGIHGTTIIQIDGGDLTITAAEGIEATYVQINGGDIYIKASDDGINAGRKSSAYSPVIEFNGGYTTVVMGAGDTDGIDSNGDIYVNGGIIDVTGNSTFDYDGTAEYNGGTIIVNGNETTTIPNQFGGGRGGMGGGPGGRR